MQRALFFELLGHVTAAAMTADAFEDVAEALNKVGFKLKNIQQGIELSHQGEALIERRILDYADDRNLEHSIHVAAAELEMWLQTVRFRLRKAGLDAEEQETVLGHDIHAHRHTVTAIAQGLRTLGVLRTDEALRQKLGNAQATHDIIVRGTTLIKKLYKVADELVSPSAICPSGEAIHKDFDQHILAMSQWLLSLDDALAKVADAELVGLAGWLPKGKGAPAGGTARGVTLHESASKAPPNPKDATDCSGWSVGRQGNRENIGQGWVAPTYD